ncbi:hypothetical protein [Aliivibrio fischeri]|uniref:hypothetical protein n=1 Tax=Aliivibrio fischeri TaxID=668 RepID=UPI0012DABF04|nr:hypothetical protein [Aliivibrio fischeri]MUJ39710.1 hypothetical protein [Aliivibrio fischeri]
MENIWITIISGGFSGAAVVVFLGKLLVNNAFKKSLSQYQHELDLRKQSLQTELSINAEQLKLKFSQYEESKKIALENIYASFIKTSIPRANLINHNNFQDAENFCAEYFRAYKEAFDAFDLSFKKISLAYECLEDNAIYINGETESLVSSCLSKVLISYQKSHHQLQQYHNETRCLFDNGYLSLETAPLDFRVFSDEVQANWNELASESKKALKNTIRELLTP